MYLPAGVHQVPRLDVILVKIGPSCFSTSTLKLAYGTRQVEISRMMPTYGDGSREELGAEDLPGARLWHGGLSKHLLYMGSQSVTTRNHGDPRRASALLLWW